MQGMHKLGRVLAPRRSGQSGVFREQGNLRSMHRQLDLPERGTYLRYDEERLSHLQRRF